MILSLSSVVNTIRVKKGKFSMVGREGGKVGSGCPLFFTVNWKGPVSIGNKDQFFLVVELLVDPNQPGAELAETQQCTTESRLILILANWASLTYEYIVGTRFFTWPAIKTWFNIYQARSNVLFPGKYTYKEIRWYSYFWSNLKIFLLHLSGPSNHLWTCYAVHSK